MCQHKPYGVFPVCIRVYKRNLQPGNGSSTIGGKNVVVSLRARQIARFMQLFDRTACFKACAAGLPATIAAPRYHCGSGSSQTSGRAC